GSVGIFILFIILLLYATVVIIGFTVFKIEQLIHWIFIIALMFSLSIFNASVKSSIIMAIIGHLYHKKYQKPISAKIIFWTGIPIYYLSIFFTRHGFIIQENIANFDYMIKASMIMVFLAVIFSTINVFYIKKLNH
ncbi:hypothetical protein, partial [Moraxella equi]